jgi:hypothetical protein
VYFLEGLATTKIDFQSVFTPEAKGRMGSCQPLSRCWILTQISPKVGVFKDNGFMKRN